MLGFSVIQDTLITGGDTVHTVVDSISTVIGGDAGELIAAKLALGLGLVVKVITEGTKSVIGKYTELNPFLKSLIALAWSQAAVFANQWLALHGAPSLPADPSMLGSVIDGLVVWGAAMGYNSLKDAVISGTQQPLARKVR